MHQKLVSDPIINFGKSPKTAIACKKLFLKYILKENYQELSPFWTQSLLIQVHNKIIRKQGLELAISCSSGTKEI